MIDKIEWISPGFGLRTRNGIKRHVVQYKLGNQQRRITLRPALTLVQARNEAKKILGKVAAGVDPQAVKKAARTGATIGTFRHIAVEFIQHQRDTRKRREKTVKLTSLYLLQYCKHLHPKKADDIQRSDVASTLRSIAKENGAVTADRARAALSACYAWAIGEGLCGDNYSNPVIGTNKQVEEYIPIDRVLKDTEIAAIWNACGNDDFGRIVKLLISTGCRRDEIARLKWEEVDGDLITLPSERTKNHRKFEIPLPKLARDILGDKPEGATSFVFGRLGSGFSGFSKAKAQLDAKLGFDKSWRLHDIRHTVSTGMNELGVEPHIVEAVLNHVSGYKAGVAGRYNHAAYRDQKREALAHWATYTMGVVTPNVSHLRKRRA